MYIAEVAIWALSGPPSFVQVAGHPLRWRLLGELARSDRRVRELVTLVDQPQNLVSYHLGRLRAERLVAARRSTFDARDAYYYLDLANCAAALAAAGQGKDARKLADEERARLRQQALDWLRADLTAWTRVMGKGPPEARQLLAQALQHWQKGPDLAGLRDKAALDQLPAAERDAWQRLWANVNALLQRTQAK